LNVLLTTPSGRKNDMAHTFNELLEWLKQQDEVYLLEILNINSDELVRAFLDKIEEKQDVLKREIEL